MSFQLPSTHRSLVVLSDLHLGAGGVAGVGASVLDVRDGVDPLASGSGFERFLRDEVGRHDAAVILGDALELALATYDQTAPRFARLVALLRAHGAGTVYFVPGNHDHYAWTLVRDAAAIATPFPEFRPGFFPGHAVGTYDATFLHRIGVDHVAYPLLVWHPPARPRHSVVLHHGHFCSETYRLVSDLYRDLFDGPAADLRELEGLNEGWINLVWYHLGQAGPGIGANGLIEAIYEQLRATGRSSAVERALGRLYRLKLAPLVRAGLLRQAQQRWWLTRGAADWLADRLDAVLPGWLAKAVAAFAAREAQAGRGASIDRGRALDAALVAQCDDFMRLVAATEPAVVLGDATMIFGHTHVQGAAISACARYLNTGGWVTAAERPWPDACAVSIDDAGHARVIRYTADAAPRAADAAVRVGVGAAGGI